MIFKKKHQIPEPPTSGFPESLEYKKDVQTFSPELTDNSDLPELPTTKRTVSQKNTTIIVNEGLPELPAEEPEERTIIKKDKKDKEIFIKIENFKQIVETIENLQKGLQDAEELIFKLEKMNNQEVSEIEDWKGKIDTLKEEIKTIGENLAQ